MSDKPRYKHDCDTCEFIKCLTVEGKHYDVYRCTNTAIGESTWLGRYDDGDGHYWSMPWDVLKKVDPACGTEVLRAMREIARKREEKGKNDGL